MKKYILPITVVAGLIVVLTTSCSKNSANPATPDTNSQAAAESTPSTTPMLINGAGSSFDNPAFTKWFEVYAGVDSKAQFNYQSIGSGAGQKQLLNQTVDFGASDAPMSDTSMAGAPGKILHLPVVAGGVAVIYNLPGDPKLKLDGDTLAGIYLGGITKWNDPKIVALNPGGDFARFGHHSHPPSVRMVVAQPSSSRTT